jgi:hypothetical protein
MRPQEREMKLAELRVKVFSNCQPKATSLRAMTPAFDLQPHEGLLGIMCSVLHLDILWVQTRHKRNHNNDFF